MKITYGKWRNVNKCVNCKSILTRSELMDSDGRCPECGYKGLNAGTIVDVTEHAMKLITISWWDLKFPFYHTTYETEELT